MEDVTDRRCPTLDRKQAEPARRTWPPHIGLAIGAPLVAIAHGSRGSHSQPVDRTRQAKICRVEECGGLVDACRLRNGGTARLAQTPFATRAARQDDGATGGAPGIRLTKCRCQEPRRRALSKVAIAYLRWRDIPAIQIDDAHALAVINTADARHWHANLPAERDECVLVRR